MKNILKSKIATGKACIGGWHPSARRKLRKRFSNIGFDWIALDMEHGSFSVADAENAFVACERHGCAPMVRLPDRPETRAASTRFRRARFFDPLHRRCRPVRRILGTLLFPPAGKRVLSLERTMPGVTILTKLCAISTSPCTDDRSANGVANGGKIAALDSVDALLAPTIIGRSRRAERFQI